jgi:hypothetical protein
MDRKFLRVFVGSTVVCLVLGITGCSSKGVSVSGKVKYNDAPLNAPGAKIVFVGPNGVRVEADIDSDGNYRASNVAAGTNRVAVFPGNPRAGRLPPPKGIGKNPASEPVSLPKVYTAVETSNLSAEIKEGAIYDPELIGP